MKDASVGSRDAEQNKFSFDAQNSQDGKSETSDVTSNQRTTDINDSSTLDEEIQASAVAKNGDQGVLPGTVLAAERERRGFLVADIAAQLFLTEAQIKALEVGAYEKFPAPIFVTGYLRNYARLLDVPADPLVALYNAQNPSSVPNLNRAARTTSSTPNSSMQPFDPRVVAGGVVIVVLMLLLWWGISSEDDAAVLPGDMSDLDEVATSLAPGQITESIAAPQIPASILPIDVAENSTVIKSVVGAELDTLTASDTATAQTSVDAMTLTFSDESWVEITDANGLRVMFDLGKPGQTSVLSGVAPFNILLGNSPAVTIIYNGEPFDQRRVARGKVARFTLGNNAE